MRKTALALALVALGSLLLPSAVADHSVMHDVFTTLEDPTHPQYNSIKNPCWKDEYGCGGCGPDLLEWIVGPIYCP